MPETAAVAGERRALFRLVAPAPGSVHGVHHYATLREQPTGPERFSLEVRRGLVWGSAQPVLLVRARAGGESELGVSVSAGAGPEEPAGRIADDLSAFATRALRVAADRLGVDPGAFFAASHVDLGESGTLGVEASVRSRSAELLQAAAAGSAAPEPSVGVARDRQPPSSRSGGTAPAAPAAPAAPPSTVQASGGPAAREPEVGPPVGLLGRFVGWLRRAARAALRR